MQICWKTALFVLLAVPFAIGRNVDHPKRGGRHGESRRVDPFPRTHLKLHAKPPRVLYLVEGSNEYLECKAGGSPLPFIYWLKNGEKMTPFDLSDELEPVSSNPAIVRLGTTISRLYLDCVTMEDEADYTCVAEAANHRRSIPYIVKVASSDDKECMNRKHSGAAPRINLWTGTALETENQDIKFFCRAQGDPKPTIRWLDLNNQPILDTNEKYEVAANGDLTIRNIQWADMGSYPCLAENAHGTARVESFIYPAKASSNDESSN